MIVKLIAYTPDPDKLCGMAAALCTGQENNNDRVCESALRGALWRGHESVAEHACFSFLVEGVSRVTLAQLTRHRIASFSVESQRYVKGSGREVAVPVRIAAYPDLAARFESLVEKAALLQSRAVGDSLSGGRDAAAGQAGGPGAVRERWPRLRGGRMPGGRWKLCAPEKAGRVG